MIDIDAKQGDDKSFILAGLTLENSTWDAQKKHLSSEGDNFITELPPVQLRFAHKNEVAQMPKRQTLDVPVYLNPLRKSIITSLRNVNFNLFY